MKIEEFLCYMSREEKSEKSARYYLSENGWDVDEAVKEYKKDLEWEKKNRVVTKPMKMTPYTQDQLRNKKRQ